MSGESAVTPMETTANESPVKINSENADTADMELQILAAMQSRVTHLRNKADSVTFASVRRLLEEDMGLDKYALDEHMSFVKEHLLKCLGDADETEKKDDATPVKEEADASEEKSNAKEETGDDDGDEKTVDEDAKDDEQGNREEALMSDIKRALQKRASYIKANSEEITMASLRRLLEEDLKLKKDSLVPFKKFINKELDDVLKIPDAPKHPTKPTGKSVKKKVKNTPSKKVDSEDDSDSDDEEVAEKKTPTQKRKRKTENVKPVAAKKKAKHTEADSENDSDAGDSETRVEKPLKGRETASATPVYGKRVDHLKSVIKSCGMSIPPVIYRKAKQAPEEKREATLIEELEQILAKEGLSSDPSEKEIKEVKKKKDRIKELEGIDTSNIVSSSRRRSTASFAPPPKPKITSESESESDEEESENGEEEEEEGNEEAAEEGSQSEEESNNEDDAGEESE